MSCRPFISYAKEDRVTAERLYNDLRQLGADPWLDIHQLRGGETWKDSISLALQGSTHVLTLISESSVTKTGFVQTEVRQALELLDNVPPGKIFVVPVRLDDSRPQHQRLNDLHWVDLFRDYAKGLSRIATSLELPAKGTGLQFASAPFNSEGAASTRSVTDDKNVATIIGVPNMKGTVKFFNRDKRFGIIASPEVAEGVFVHKRAIADAKFKYLVEGEEVTFDLIQGPKGPAAENVNRVEPRFSGVVERFDIDKGFGRIITDDGMVELFVHHSDIVTDQKFKKLTEGEDVDFVIAKDPRKNYRARLVTVDGRPPLERFAILSYFDEKLEELTHLTQPENWNYKNTPSARPYPILNSYLHYTFKRLQEESKIAFAENTQKRQKLAAFNTGLMTKHFEPIFATFHENTHATAASPRVLIGFCTESQPPMTFFANHPERANYFTEPVDLIYDRRIKLVKNVSHIIIDRLDRFPKQYQDNPRNLAAILNMAVEQAETRVAANYKTAIPVFNRGRIHLLLPLCLEDPGRADLALVVGREEAVYKGYTVLTLDQAYNSARLLTRPDDEWLAP